MRWWDAGARWKAGLASLHLVAFASMAGGPGGRAAALGTAAVVLLLIVHSLRVGPPSGALTLTDVPRIDGAVLLGRGFEWTLETSQDFLETGRAAWPSDGDLLLPDELLGLHTLVLGTTGVGKTRLLELLALQAIARGDA